MVKPIVGKLDGDELNSDWLGSLRLSEKAQKGDIEAKQKLEKRESTKMVPLTDAEEKEINSIFERME